MAPPSNLPIDPLNGKPTTPHPLRGVPLREEKKHSQPTPSSPNMTPQKPLSDKKEMRPTSDAQPPIATGARQQSSPTAKIPLSNTNVTSPSLSSSLNQQKKFTTPIQSKKQGPSTSIKKPLEKQHSTIKQSQQQKPATPPLAPKKIADTTSPLPILPPTESRRQNKKPLISQPNQGGSEKAETKLPVKNDNIPTTKKGVSDADEKLPPGHYEIRTMHEDLIRLRHGGPVRPESIKTKSIQHVMKKGEGPPGTPKKHQHETLSQAQKDINTITEVIPSESSPPPVTSRRFSFLSSRFIMVGVAIIVVAIASLWFFVLQPQKSTTINPEPSPPIDTAPPPSNNISLLRASYPETAPTFITSDTKVITSITSTSIANDLLALIERGFTEKSITHLEFAGALNAEDFLSFTEIMLPDSILNDLSTPNPASPMLIAINNDDLRLGLIIPATNAANISSLRSNLRSWEWRIDEDVAILFTNIPKGSSATTFQDNTYKGVAMRYRNFSEPDVALDYAIVETKDMAYLIVTTSRESMFHTIDTLLEL